uniref:Uncharacterized protein n=1 Tax=Mastacembelus armatus TaxID=205130 RepID=A0A3Q3SZ24_9TELE
TKIFRPIFLDFQLVNIQWNTKHETSAVIQCVLVLCVKYKQPGKMSDSSIVLFCFQMLYLQKQVHTSPRELCRTVFRVPTCCSRGKINVEQAKGRNAFKAPLIELYGLQSQKLSASTRPRLVRS